MAIVPPTASTQYLTIDNGRENSLMMIKKQRAKVAYACAWREGTHLPQVCTYLPRVPSITVPTSYLTCRPIGSDEILVAREIDR